MPESQQIPAEATRLRNVAAHPVRAGRELRWRRPQDAPVNASITMGGHGPRIAGSLAGLAAMTNRIRFGTMVSANTFRHPAILAKQAVTLDRMSGGRLEIGVGTGWHEQEHAAFGIPLPPISTRFDMLEETFEVLHGLFTEERFTFAGKHHHIVDAVFEPKPVQTPRPPFVVGGTGPRRTIPLAARWADQWNFPDFTNDPGLFQSCLRRLDEACEEGGRDRGDIEVSVQFRFSGDTEETMKRAEIYEELGADHILVSFTPPGEASLPARVAEALAR